MLTTGSLHFDDDITNSEVAQEAMVTQTDGGLESEFPAALGKSKRAKRRARCASRKRAMRATEQQDEPPAL